MEYMFHMHQELGWISSIPKMKKYAKVQKGNLYTLSKKKALSIFKALGIGRLEEWAGEPSS